MAVRLRSFIKPVSITHLVDGQECEFRPISPRVFVENLLAFKGLMAVGSRLLQDDPNTRAESHEIREGVSSTLLSPPDLQMIEKLRANRAADVQSFFDGLAKPDVRIAIARIIVNSTRDEELYGAPDAVLASWIDDPDMNFAVLADLLLGVWKANKETFSPLVARVRGVLRPHLNKVAEPILETVPTP